MQENRFQLESDQNQDRLFILSRRATADAADLRAWERSRRHVIVRYAPADGLIAEVAESVIPTNGSSAA